MTAIPGAMIGVLMVAALLGLIAPARSAQRVIAVASSALALILATIEMIAPANSATIDTIGALPVAGVSVPLQLLSDRASGAVAFAVALVTCAVQVYSVRYLASNRNYRQFAATVSIFAAAMLLVVHSADLILTLVGWEVMGWCSYLLIGHDTHREAARRAAYKAFLVTRIADIGMVLGLIALASRVGSTQLMTVLTSPPSGWVTFGLIGVIIGVAGKSGLIPFHDWLPDAMEGPTPASALIHAATMVAAGSYVLARLLGLLTEQGSARWLLAILTAATMLYAAALAFVQVDFKRMLAYSTLSQVALMTSGLAVVAPATGPMTGQADGLTSGLTQGLTEGAAPTLAHLMAHAYFKALLFLLAGVLTLALGSTAWSKLRSALAGGERRAGSPHTQLQVLLTVGLAALVGLPPLVGFFSKDALLGAAIEAARTSGGPATLVAVAQVITVVLTAAYATRIAVLLLTRPRGDAPVSSVSDGLASTTSAMDPPSPAPVVTVQPVGPELTGAGPVAMAPAIALGLASVVGVITLLGIHGAVHLDLVTALLSVALVVAAGLGIWQLSNAGDRDPAELVPASLRAHAVRGFGIDRAYVAIANAVLWLARGAAVLDRDAIDIYPRGLAAATRAGGQVGDRVHRGIPTLAVLAVLAGTLVVAVIGVLAWS